MATVGVDFFRVDRSGTTRRLLIVAGGLVTAGATTIGAHLVSNFGEGVARALSLLGGGVTIAGLVLGFGAMAMLLFENVYLLIKEEGLLFHDNGKETTVPWPDLEEAALEADSGFVVFKRKEGSPLRWFAGAAAKNLQTRVEDAKRKALHGLLKMEH
ncbi:MAG: hypothetical protein KIT84_37135 [Labilithrix sp.]|nr:hypothetical protein [Labilithrix sp.]